MIENKLRAIINHFGKELQWLKLSEECGEVHKAICRYEYGATESNIEISEEIADLEVIIAQMKLIYEVDEEYINRVKHEKIDRTIRRYNITY